MEVVKAHSRKYQPPSITAQGRDLDSSNSNTPGTTVGLLADVGAHVEEGYVDSEGKSNSHRRLSSSKSSAVTDSTLAETSGAGGALHRGGGGGGRGAGRKSDGTEGLGGGGSTTVPGYIDV